MANKNCTTTNGIDWLIRIWTIGTIFWFTLSYFNLMPYYQVKLIKIDTITPTFSLLPGTQIRLGIESYDNSLKAEIATVKWSLCKGQSIFEFEGLEPTIILPPTESGLYQLKVMITMFNGKVKTGITSIYVVQDKAIIVKVAEPIQFQLTPKDANEILINKVQSSSSAIEVYSGNGQWTDAEKISSKNNVAFELKPNSTISSFNNQIIIRVKGNNKELNNYDVIQVPELGKHKNPECGIKTYKAPLNN